MLTALAILIVIALLGGLVFAGHYALTNWRPL